MSALTLIQNDDDNLTSKDRHTGVSKLDDEHLVILILSNSILKKHDIDTASVGAIDPEQERNLDSQIVNISCKRETEMNSKVVIFCGVDSVTRIVDPVTRITLRTKATQGFQ